MYLLVVQIGVLVWCTVCAGSTSVCYTTARFFVCTACGVQCT